MMAKKGDQLYFDHFVSCAQDACDAAKVLSNALEHFDYSAIQLKMEEIHQLEHQADLKRNDLTEELLRAFMTPIEREDIAELCHYIDEMVDCLDDVLIRVYINNVTSIRPDAVGFSHHIVRCCEATREALRELPAFRKSKELKGMLVEIGRMEEVCDQLFIEAMRRLHTESKDALEIIAWRDIYIYLEKCADACEHVARSMERIVIKNS